MIGLRKPPNQACERFTRARWRARRYKKHPEKSRKLSMPLLNSRVARRANGRHIAHPVGPIIAKRRVFMTPALAAAERCHGLHSGRDALVLLRPEDRAGPRRPFTPTSGLALRS